MLKQVGLVLLSPLILVLTFCRILFALEVVRSVPGDLFSVKLILVLLAVVVGVARLFCRSGKCGKLRWPVEAVWVICALEVAWDHASLQILGWLLLAQLVDWALDAYLEELLGKWQELWTMTRRKTS